MLLVFEARWLNHENLFLDISLKESIIDVQMVYWPIMCKSKSEDDFDGLWTNHRSKGLHEIKARALGDLFATRRALYLAMEPLGLHLIRKKPLAPHFVFIFGRGNKGQSSISNEGIKLITNSFSPVSMLYSFTDIGRVKIFSQGMLGSTLLGLKMLF